MHGAYVAMPDSSYEGPLAELSDEQRVTREALRRHVDMLATEIGERHLGCHPVALERAAAYIEGELSGQGYEVRRQSFDVEGATASNLEARLAGGQGSGELVVVGAHYDSAFYTRGANDNASGVAALLELARLLNGRRFSREVRFVAFSNEEPPHFQTGAMGSYRYAKGCAERGELISAMLSLETMGYYNQDVGSQRYPPVVSWFYPARGNFIAFVGNFESRSLVRASIGAFRRSAQFPSEGGALPGSLTGVGWSDHWAFWQFGYPALMVTDTAVFRYPFYHTPHDTPDKMDFDRMARVVVGLVDVVAHAANAEP
jgi:Zn-dependent M28 family amino/carboxypeptidase